MISRQIQELPLSSSFFRRKVKDFLQENGLRLEDVSSYYAIENDEGGIVAGAGISGDVIKCVAVAASSRSEGLVAPIISHIISEQASKGISNLKVFTKPENREIFESLGFRFLAGTPGVVFMENGGALSKYCKYLESNRREGSAGLVVMNANPFTLGHKYLLDQAVSQVDTLYVIPVLDNAPGGFPYEERLAMIRAGAPENVVVLEGSSYQISAQTFPTYFLKDLSKASEMQMLLDLEIFDRHIAPALGVSVRFVGSEPSDALTARYNALMKETLSCKVAEIPRSAVSATHVRRFIADGSFGGASALVPESSRPFILAALAERALKLELDTPFKPGLVCPESSGAHKDMDYSTMQKGIAAIRPFFPAMAMSSSAEELRRLGIEAEEAMMDATGGVNTHRGAIYAMGIALKACGDQSAMADIARGLLDNELKTSKLAPRLRGARAIAAGGYRPLFDDWLPLYSNLLERNTVSSALQKTLLRIMSTLDDTCVVKRVGQERADKVKKEAGKGRWLKMLCRRYEKEGISPGGAADMLALMIFIDSIQK